MYVIVAQGDFVICWQFCLVRCMLVKDDYVWPLELTPVKNYPKGFGHEPCITGDAGVCLALPKASLSTGEPRVYQVRSDTSLILQLSDDEACIH